MPFLALFSKSFYQESSLRGKGFHGLYLLIVVGLLLIVPVISFNHGLRVLAAETAPRLLGQVPEIQLAQGRVFCAAPQPYEIRDPETGELWVLIDTRAEALENASEAYLALTQSQVIVHKSKYETRVFSLANATPMVINQGVLQSWLRIFLISMAFISFPAALVFMYFVKLFQALMFAVIGLILSGLFKAGRLPFSGVFRIAVLALTPVMILKAVLGAVHYSLPADGWIYFGLTTAYVLFGLYAAGQGLAASAAAPNAVDPEIPRPPAPIPEPLPTPKNPPAKVKKVRTKSAAKPRKTVKATKSAKKAVVKKTVKKSAKKTVRRRQ